MNYIQSLVEEFHSTVIATIGKDGRPQTRVIDMMLYDNDGVYFLTAKGKEFYTQLMKQSFVSLSATKDKKAISLRGKIRNIGSNKLDDIFGKNSYMKDIYPEDTRRALEVFQVYEATGEFFDISNPSHIFRDSFTIGNIINKPSGFTITSNCIGCNSCYNVCPQKCIDTSSIPFVINQNNCLHCGECFTLCPTNAVIKL